MPIIYLSPSTQDWNPYVTGSGSEEYWMNRIADAMEPYLRANGIRYRRNDPDTSAAAAIREANSGYYDSGRATRETTTSIWPSIPTPSETGSRKIPRGGSLPFTTPPAPAASGGRS